MCVLDRLRYIILDCLFSQSDLMNLDLGSSLIYPNGPSFPTKDCFWPRGGVLKSRGWLIKCCWKASMPWYAKLTFQSQNDEVALWQMFPVDAFFDHGSRSCRNMYISVYLIVELGICKAKIFRQNPVMWPPDIGAKPPWGPMSVLDTVQEAQLFKRRGWILWEGRLSFQRLTLNTWRNHAVVS